jgi:hypothetical protein
LIGDFRDAVRIRQTARSQTGQDVFELIRLEADQIEVETGELECPELVAELLGVPAGPRRQLIVGHAIGALLVLAPAVRHDHRDEFEPQLCRGTDARMTGEQHTLLVGQHRHRPSPFEDGGSDFVEVGLAMEPGVVRVGYQPLDRPALHLVGRARSCRPHTRGPRWC